METVSETKKPGRPPKSALDRVHDAAFALRQAISQLESNEAVKLNRMMIEEHDMLLAEVKTGTVALTTCARKMAG